jgi:hypothetical protein
MGQAMLFDPEYFPFWCVGYLLITAFLCICTGSMYHVNARRPSDDPNKRDFHFGAVVIVTILWPVLLLVYAGLFLLKAFALALSLIVVAVALIAIRKPFLLAWIQKTSSKMGNRLLEWNTALIYAFLGKEPKKPPS